MYIGSKKKILLLTIFAAASPWFVFAQKQLENNYPKIGGFSPQTIATQLPDFIKYIFTLCITISGVAAFGALIYAGVIYYTSAGNAEKRAKSRNIIKTSFLGLIILLFSWLILNTINPQLNILNIGIENPTPGAPQASQLPSDIQLTEDLFGRLKNMAQKIKLLPDQIKTSGETIQKLTNNCDCKNTLPLCICKNYLSGSCGSAYCYAANEKQPCPDGPAIKQEQEKIMELHDEMLYYRNRARDEATDLDSDLNKNIIPKIDWYEKKISSEEKILSQLPKGGEKEIEQKMIDLLKESKKWLNEEMNYKNYLKIKFGVLADSIEKIDGPSTQLAQLPALCFSDIDKKCQGSCTGGCHNTTGCFPSGCSAVDSKAPNPCPVNRIQSELDKITPLPKEIKNISDQIIKLIDSIPPKHQRTVQF